MGSNSLVLSFITLVIYKLDWTKCLKIHCRNGLTLAERWIRSPDKSFSSLIDPILLHSGFANLEIWTDRIVTQIVLSRAYFSKYFYVGSQSPSQMLIKPPSLVEVFPVAHTHTTLHYAACTGLQADLPQRALASGLMGTCQPILLWVISAGQWLCFSKSVWLVGVGKLKPCCHRKRLQWVLPLWKQTAGELNKSLLVNNFFGFHRNLFSFDWFILCSCNW